MAKRTTLATLILLALSTTATHAATWNASASLHRFDQRVAGGLPLRGFRIHATDEAGLVTRARLSVDTRLETQVALPDGSHMVTYTGQWRGKQVTISRGDGQLLIDSGESTFPTPVPPDDSVARFDLAVTAGLPARIPLAGSALTNARAADDDLVVFGAFGGDIVFADGSHGQMYEATWHGSSVVVTRSGSHLDITSLSATGVDITGFNAGSPTIEHENLPAERTSGKESPDSNRVFAAPSRAAAVATEDLNPSRLTFHLMLHDDVDLTSQRIHAGYVAWWLADLQRNILPGKKVDLLYSRGISGVTDMKYEYVGSLHDWSDVVGHYALEQGIPRTYKHKFMLIVKGLPEPDRHGRSWQKGTEGIASISGRYPEIAHQLGHLLGALHGNAEVRYGGWWCETNMYTPSLIVRSNCYGYSAENMYQMSDYIRTADGLIENSRWSEDR